MSWISRLVASIRGESRLADSLDALMQRVVDRVEPEIWGLIHAGIPTSTYAEARGYVWARAALPVQKTTNEVASQLRPSLRARMAAEARSIIADRVVEQLRMYERQPRDRRAA